MQKLTDVVSKILVKVHQSHVADAWLTPGKQDGLAGLYGVRQTGKRATSRSAKTTVVQTSCGSA